MPHFCRLTHTLTGLFCLGFSLCLSPASLAQSEIDASPVQTVQTPSLEQQIQALADRIHYGKQGFEFTSQDDRFSLAIQSRLQFRYANPFDSDPRSLSDLEKQSSSFMIRRARTKLKGHAYWPWLKYYLQYDWADPVLRDFNLSIEKYPWAELWLGRGKVLYNDERITSSGKQQFVNRSIVNDLFTLDRQEGIQLSGALFPESWHSFNYALGVFTGLGVGERNNDDSEMMYSARLQWNVLGQEMAFSQSDLAYHEQPSLSLAVAAASNQSKCTSFATSQDSCRSLPQFESGKAGQYRLNQIMEEIRFKWRGLSLKHELHGKTITDTLTSPSESKQATHMLGGLVQVGYFPHFSLPFLPRELELAGRYAFVDPNTARQHDLQHEISGVINYFLSGHDHKISLQLSHLIVADPTLKTSQAAQRLWLQWDISF